MKNDKLRFVKSRDTRTPVANSERQLREMLERYGCTKFALAVDHAERRSQITFTVPNDAREGAPLIPVRLEVRTDLAAEALFGPLKHGQNWTEHGLAQAERVAWRNLLLWVDAALASAAMNLQPISHTFLAQTLTPHPDGSGRTVTVAEAIAQSEEPGIRGLLGAGSR